MLLNLTAEGKEREGKVVLVLHHCFCQERAPPLFTRLNSNYTEHASSLGFEKKYVPDSFHARGVDMIIITCCKHSENSLGLICIVDFQVGPTPLHHQ